MRGRTINFGVILRFVIVAMLFIGTMLLLSPAESAEAQVPNADRCQITLYSDGNWSNELYTFYDQEHSTNLRGFNDDANSVRVANCDAVVAQNFGGGGWCYTLAPGSYRLPVDQLSYLDLDAKGCAYSDRVVVGGAWVRLDDIANHGMPPQSRCPYGVPGRGFYGSVRTARGIDDFGLLCGEPDEAANIRGSISESNFRGAAPFTTTCGRNKVLVGARGTVYPDLVQSISPICATVDSNGNWLELSDGTNVGPRTKASYTRQCPNHYAVVAAEMWSGDGLDGLTLLCSPLKASIEPCPVLPTPTPIPPVPTATPMSGSNPGAAAMGAGGEIIAANFKPTPTPRYYQKKPTPTHYYKKPTATPVPKKPTPTATPVKVVPPPRATPVPPKCPAVILPGNIGDRVWFDVDADGVQEAGEAGINDVLVELRDASGALIATQFTSDNGDYLFEGYAPNSYRVTIDEASLPVGVEQTYELDGSLDGDSAVTLRSGESRLNLDFGYRFVLGSIGDRVWLDANGDQNQDGNEAGINGVRIELLQASQVVATQITRGDGDYLFEGLRPGAYAVRVVTTTLPQDADQTFDADGGLDNRSNLTLGVADDNLEQDFGYRVLDGAIGDRVWLDTNGDQVQDGNEDGINDVTVELVQAGQVVATQVTAGDGDYLFGNLRSGNYAVRIDSATLPANVSQTFDADGGLDDRSNLTLASGETNLEQDFGYVFVPGTIGDRVWLDADGNQAQDPGEAGINGVRVELLRGGNVIDTMVTAGDGNYLFEDVVAGAYAVRVVASTLPQDATQTFDADGGLDNRSNLTLAPADSNLDQDFGYRLLAGTIGDRVWLDANGDQVQDGNEDGINDVTVELLRAGSVVDTAVTAGDGDYLFTGLPSGDYAVRVDASTLPADTRQTFDADGGLDNRSNLALASGDSNLDQDFGYEQLGGTIGDRVWLDTDGDEFQDGNEDGINDVTVELVQAGSVVATQVTAGDGDYLFTGLLSGEYVVRIDPATLPANVSQTFDADGGLDDQSVVTLAPGETNLNQDFGYVFLPGTIGDRVWFDADANQVQDPGETGINDVRVFLEQGGAIVRTQITSGDGNYLFEDIVLGDYTVRIDPSTLPQDASQTFDADGGLDDESSLTLGAADSNLDQDFGYQLLVGTIGDRVWLDADGDQQQGAGEAGLNDITVELVRGGVAIDSAVTSGDGDYLFTGLRSGDYAVRVVASTLPADATQTFDADGGLDNRSNLALASGDSNLDQDFGYRILEGAIGDTVWLDADRSGTINNGETRLDGVSIELVDGGGQVIGTDTTENGGLYLFDGLPSGTYTVRVVASTLPVGTEQTFDADGLATANESTLTLGSGDSNLDQDFGYVLLSGTIGDFVWFDDNGDAQQDADEPGIPNALVTLFRIDGGADVQVDQVETSPEGAYLFTGLESGSYAVVIDGLPGGDISQTADPDGGNDNRSELALGAGEVNLDQDFGYQLLGAIGDLVWFNKAPDGPNPTRDLDIFDQDDEPLPEVTVRLFDAAGVEVGEQVTDINGNYNFTGLQPGEYEVRVDRRTLPPIFGGRAISFWQANFDLDRGVDPFGNPLRGDGISREVLDRGEVVDTHDFGFNGLD